MSDFMYLTGYEIPRNRIFIRGRRARYFAPGSWIKSKIELARWFYSFCSNIDKFGVLKFISLSSFSSQVGDMVWLIPGHCDPTVNLHDWMVGIRDDKVETIWPITGRGPGVWKEEENSFWDFVLHAWVNFHARFGFVGSLRNYHLPILKRTFGTWRQGTRKLCSRLQFPNISSRLNHSTNYRFDHARWRGFHSSTFLAINGILRFSDCGESS